MIFEVVATSGTALSYQWLKNGANISGATLSSYTRINAQASDQAVYSVKVINGGGTVTSSNATLTVLLPPTITTQPLTQTVVLGTTAFFSVSASGWAPFTYQWTFNDVPLANATNETLTVNNVQTNQAGSYAVVVTNPLGSAGSTAATLTVNTPPSITTQPVSQAVTVGQTASFTVEPAGTAPFTYQWYLNGATLGSSGRSATYIKSNVGTGDAGDYTVVVANAAGSVLSAAATLIAYVPPSLSSPSSVTVVQGQTATFSVVASGSSPFSYQWNVNGVNVTDGPNISGANSNFLTLSNVQGWQAGNVYVVVTNLGGSATSSVKTLTVNVPAAITTQPTSLTVTQGQTAVFAVEAIGTPNLGYQWYFNNVKMGSGSTSTNLVLSSANTNVAGSYTVVVNNSYGSVTSAVVTLTVLVPAQIATQPTNQAVILGQSASFSVGAFGDAPLSYQWSFNGVNISGATGPTLALSNLQTNQAGNYAVRITNSWGSVTSTDATLTVYVPTSITTQPQSQALIQGQTVSFSVVPGGSGPFTYQWYLNGATLGSGARSSTYTKTGIGTGEAGDYTVTVTGPGGSVTSAVATLIVYVPPGISSQPSSLTVVQGQTATFSVTVSSSGSAPFSYQWNVNGTNVTDGPNISGSTSNFLTLSNVQAGQAGNVFVVITNNGGTITSTIRTLTVNVPAAITNQPTSLTVTQGQTATFSVGAIGTPTLAYQWYLNGVSLGNNFKTAAIAVPNTGTNNAGSYTVVVNNSYGSVSSAPVSLTVLVPAQIATQPTNQAVILGQSASFSVGAFGDAPLRYQWSFNGTNLSGATNFSLSLTNVQTNQAGNYAVFVTNSWGSTTSTNATLTVYVPPGITTQPQSQAIVLGQSVAFSAAVDGSAPITYQWYFNGISLGTSARSLTYSISAVAANHGGNYSLVASGPGGSSTSSVAVLTVLFPAGIGTQPVSRSVVQGQSTSFSVVPTGSEPLSYQWNGNGKDLPGATNSTLVINNAQYVQAGSYFVTVANPWGSATSAAVNLTVTVPPGSDLPTMQDLVAHLTFDGDLVDSSGRGNHAAAVGTPNLVPGVIGTGSFNPFTQSGSNNYATFGRPTDLLFSKGVDFTIAFWARLPAGAWTGVAADPPFISNKSWSSGDNTGWVLATGDDGRFQWNYTESGSNPRKDYDGPAGTFGNPTWHHVAVSFQRGGNAITYLNGVRVNSKSISPGGTLPLKSVDTSFPVNIGNDGTGNYGNGYWTFPLGTVTNGLNMDDLGIWRRVLPDQEICAIYNAGLSGQDFTAVTTNMFTLVALPRITKQPLSRNVNTSSNATLSVTADGSATLRYQWYGNGTLLSGRTSASLTLTNVQAAQVGSYWVVVTNLGGSVTSSVAALNLNTIPTIDAQPQSQIVVAGSDAAFSVEAGGAVPLKYQWKLGATPVPGATNSTLLRSSVQAGDVGNYTVVITNALGAVTSAVATLTIEVPPAISVQPVSQTITQGMDTSFSVQATGTPSPFYQWRLNGSAIPGANNATLLLANVQNRNAGNYTLVVTNIAGAVTSTVASLTVILPPAHPHALWLSTQGPTSATGQSPASWSSNSVVSFNFPELTFGSNSTWGTFRNELDFQPPQPIRAFYYVNSTNRVGNPGTDFELWPGDLLVVFNVTVPTTFGSVTDVLRSDVLVYRPGPGRDYENGTFSMLLNNPLGIDGSVYNVHAISLVEQDTMAGNTLIPKGTFLMARSPMTDHMNVYTYRPQSVGPGTTTTSPGTLLLSGSKLGITGAKVKGLDLIESPVIIGGKYLTAGQMLMTLDAVTALNPAGENLTVQPTDGFILDVSATEQDPTPNTVATATPFFDGSNVGLDDAVASEAMMCLTLVDWVNLIPLIISQPASQTKISGDSANFSVSAKGGSSTLAYQWTLNGAPLPGATNTTLALSNVQTNQVGNYVLVITNFAGSVTSTVATLTVNGPPGITTPPQSQVKTAGDSATFSVVATGTGPLSYQWNRNSTPLAGATGSTLMLNAVQSADAGSYTVTVTNLAGSITSAAANLTVTHPPSALSVSGASAMTPAGFDFQASVPAGSTFVVEASANLVDWTPIATNVAETASFSFTDPNAANSAKRFYRVVVW